MTLLLTTTYKSVRTLAKEQGVNINELIDILRIRRPDGSQTEHDFCEWLMKRLPAADMDTFGNIIVRIGESKTMWSCHTDTVHKDGGFQNVRWEGDVLHLNEGKPGQCLGADDGAGVWLMLQMIDAGKPGLYIFHRAEEFGGKGSDYLTKNTPSVVDGIERAIAFDRKGVDSIITHQMRGRCCSDEFAEALARELNQFEGFQYSSDPTGSFTDTANYTDLIGECTNLSVGYYKQHGPLETLDVMHLFKLREAILAIDFEALPTVRAPGEVDEDDYGYGSWGGSYSSYGSNDDWESPMEKLIRTRAYMLSLFLEDRGFTARSLDAELTDFSAEYFARKYGRKWGNASKAPANDETETTTEALFCNECVMAFAPYSAEGWFDGDHCPQCDSRDTVVELVPADEAYIL